jgi:DNA-binding LacI/PurR family transcriptional regulator
MAEKEPERTSESFTSPSRFRLAGYAAAMAEAGLAIEPDLQLSFLDPNRAAGIVAVKSLLALAKPPDAIFCFNDLLALGALRGLHDAGLRVPEDIAVAGFDDIEEGAYATPSLTTISPDKRAIAWRAVELLIDRIQGRRIGPPERFELPFHLIERESTIGRTRIDSSANRLIAHASREEVTASPN